VFESSYARSLLFAFWSKSQIFSTAGGVSFIWWIFWNIFVYSSPETHPRIVPVEKNYIMKTVGTIVYEQVSLTHVYG